MPTDVVMPQMGESIFEGTITKWLKQAGDRVEKDDPLFEISTDKVDAEIPSPISGVLNEIKIGEGETVQVNTVVAVISDAEAPGAKPGTQRAAAPAAQPAPAVAAPKTPAPKSSGPASPPAQAAPASGGIQVVMPQMGESIFEGTITKWLKQVGDRVEKDDLLFEISTDKVDAEIPSPASGVLSEIKIGEGETVQVNTVVAVIDGAPAVPAAAPQAAGQLAGQAAGQLPGQLPGHPAAQPAAQSAPKAEARGEGRPARAAEPGRDEDPAAAGLPIRSSPLVRRIAKEHNIDLAQIAGTGQNGRVTKDDILRYLDRSPERDSEHDLEQGRATPAATVRASERPKEAPAPLPGHVAPLSRMRAIIAQRMVESMQISPHVHTVYKIDMTRVVRVRERAKERFEQQQGIKLTYLPFVATAAVAALRKFPVVNASLADNAIHYHANINLGIAVALEWGLIVPVVRQAEQRSFDDLARTIADLAGRARSKKLTPDEVGGSTFTLTNSGIFGDEFSTPIINQPDSAILCISGLKKEAVVLTGADGDDIIAIRSMQHFTLGFDHRLIDGADACRFMLEFKRVLEQWELEIG